jgi:Glycosyltransferase family 92
VHYLSICAIFRNEAPYLHEWIEFHKLIGAERFFLYDNGSIDDSRAVVVPYVSRGEATITDWPQHPGQLDAYNDCIERHREESRWIAFIDLDEFLFSPTGRPVPEVLQEFERWPAVGANWALFGTSGHASKPPGLVIENYLFRWRIPGARPTVKSIVDPRRVEWCDNPHYFWYRDEALAVDELKRPITGPEFAFTESPSWSLLQVNHYWTKSEEEFSEKLADPRGDTGTFRPAIAAQPGDSRDDTILMYLPALKAALAADQTRTKQSRTRP